jgi:aminopeptidase
MTIENFDVKLQAYADVIVACGLNLQPGQRLIISALVEAAPLVRKVTESAYRRGCRYVETLYSDELVTLARFNHAPADSFEETSNFLFEGILKHVQEGGAYLSITSQNPDLLKGQDPERVALVDRIRATRMKPTSQLLRRNAFNWCIAGYPSEAWAAKVFPDVPEGQRIERLWEALFKVTRADLPDPVTAWQQHNATLHARRNLLTEKQYASLHLYGGGADLKIGLAEGHRWMGGSAAGQLGMDFIPNLPTEEVFTLPHKQRIDGVVCSTKPLSYAGSLMDDFRLTFENGRVVKIEAGVGEEALRKIIETDEGAASLGEVALVPYHSPVSESGILFFNTLFDENAASHLALGNGLNFCLQDGETLEQEQYLARGGNSSLVHVDFMVGSEQMNVDGLTADGRREAIMRNGEFVI